MQPSNRKLVPLALVLSLLLTLLNVPTAGAVPLPATPCSDLRVTNFVLDPAAPVEGLNTQIAITVLNQGDCATIPFAVQWKAEVFAPTGPSFQIPSLGPNETTTINLTFAFPRSGDFLTLASIDTSNAVNETNEANNLAIFSVRVAPPQPDLLITDFTITPERPVLGRPARASITVRNQGNYPATSFIVLWQPSLDTPDIARQVDSLGPGESTTLTFDYTYPWFGNYLTRATVDDTNRVAEADEFNNTIIKPITVEPPLPDLIVSDIVISPTPVVKDSISTATITVKNQGNTDAGVFMVQWKPTVFSPDLMLQVNELAAGASTTISFNFTFPFGGTFDSEAVADSTGRVLELDEFNNSKRVSVAVQPDVVDLAIRSVTLSPGSTGPGNQVNVKLGDRETVTIRVVNLGNSPARNFIVEWNPGSFFLETPGASSLSQQVDSLGPGEERDIQFQFTYVQTGNFRAVAKVDAFNNLIEDNEANNEALLNVTVDPAVDLVVTGIRMSTDPGPVTRGSEVQATITVRNNGSFPAGEFFIRWRPDTNLDFGPIARVDGLNPGESKDVVLETVYFTTGTFTTDATADFFSQIPESDEGNNSFSRQVQVEPRRTVVRVTFTNVRVIHALEDGINGEGEWQMLYAILDPEAQCRATLSPGVIDDINLDVPGVECRRADADNLGTDDGERMSFDPGVSFEVTLVEFTPLIVAAAGVQDGSIVEPPDFVGFVLQLHDNATLQGTQSFTLPGQRGQCDGERCFDLTYQVEVLSAPPSLVTGSAQLATPLAPAARLPGGLSAIIPHDASLPPGVQWRYDLYLPLAR